jgi:hypothetical protein
MRRWKKSLRVKRRHWCHLIAFDSLFQKFRCSTPRKRTVKPGDAFENYAYGRWCENVNGRRLSKMSTYALHFVVKWMPSILTSNRFRQVQFSPYHRRINPTANPEAFVFTRKSPRKNSRGFLRESYAAINPGRLRYTSPTAPSETM